MKRLDLLVPVLTIVAALAAAPAHAAQPWVSGSVGAAQAFEPSRFARPELALELNLPTFWESPAAARDWGTLGLALGASIDRDSLYAFAGLKWHAETRAGFALSWVFGFGWRAATDDAFPLGQPWLFRIEMRYLVRVTDWLLLGVSFTHRSNANITDENPGTETVALAFEFRRHRGGR